MKAALLKTLIYQIGQDYIVKKKHLNSLPDFLVRNYAKKRGGTESGVCDQCRRALTDIPEPGDPECPKPCQGRWAKRKGILHDIKLKIVEGGTNFGTPFRRLKDAMEKPCEPKPAKEPVPAPPLPPPMVIPEQEPPRGVKLAILGADTPVGQYICLMLKQCPHIKKLNLYQTREQDCVCPPGNIAHPYRRMYEIVQDLQHIDTSCVMKAYSCSCYGDLNMCLRNVDIVVMLESGYSCVDMPFDKRFACQAPMVKHYSEMISLECPKAMILVCVSPVDCMVPLVAKIMMETDWYDPRKLIGSMALPEMRASTLAARSLGLDPKTTKVPCVGGTEGEALVPLFSKAVNYYEFARCHAELMATTVRTASMSVARCDSCCLKCADVSEAHALARLVNTVAHALVCQDLPRITGFVETDPSEVISPARFIGNTLELNGSGIFRNLGIPALSDHEIKQVNMALKELSFKRAMVQNWYCRYRCSKQSFDGCKTCDWFMPSRYEFNDCAYTAVM